MTPVGEVGLAHMRLRRLSRDFQRLAVDFLIGIFAPLPCYRYQLVRSLSLLSIFKGRPADVAALKGNDSADGMRQLVKNIDVIPRLSLGVMIQLGMSIGGGT